MSDNINNPCDLAVRCVKAELRVEQLAKDLEQQKKWNECTAEAYRKMEEKLENAEKDKNRAVMSALHNEYRKCAIESHAAEDHRIRKDAEIGALKDEIRLLRGAHEADRGYIRLLRGAHEADRGYIRVLEGWPAPGLWQVILLYCIAAAIGVELGLCIAKVIL